MTGVTAAQRRYLTDCGVGARYHGLSLARHPLVMDFTDAMFGEVESGDKGLLMVGDSAKTREAFVLLTRWFVLTGKTAHLCGLASMGWMLDSRTQSDRVAESLDADFFSVTGVQQSKDSPLAPRESGQFMEFVVHRVDSLRSTFLLSDERSLDGWWPRGFSNFVAENFVTLEYHG